MVISMRQSGLAHNSISSYLRVFRTFLNWARKAGYTDLEMANYKDKETVKETYTDAELMLLLQKPARSCDFCEYRNWVIINFLVNCGCRAGTIRNIQNRDVDFERKQVIFRHTKTGKIQTIPLCSMLVSILSDYVAMRGGEPSDYLFCSVYGTMLSENALKLAIADYNHKRGVLKTSIHMFRHTFARKYLMDCGGDAFTFQHLLGHSTLQMTKHYCAIFDSDIAGNFDLRSPLAQLCKPRERIHRYTKTRKGLICNNFFVSVLGCILQTFDAPGQRGFFACGHKILRGVTCARHRSMAGALDFGEALMKRGAAYAELLAQGCGSEA